MAIDIAAKLAEIRAKKAAEANAANTNIVTTNAAYSDLTPEPIVSTEIVHADTVSAANTTVAIGTTKTSEIDHLAFLTKHQELAEAILHQHPRMPVLLMEIHKHLREDPELVTTLSEEQIATIVNGLKVQTKTELVGTIAKQAKSRDKKTKISLDML